MAKKISLSRRMRWLIGYIGLYSAATLVAMIVGGLALFGRVRIRGYWRTCAAILRGNVIIASNHPSALETIVIPVCFWPFALLMPRLYPWSIARDDAFPSAARWLHGPFRCIIVKPGVNALALNRPAWQAMNDVLGSAGILAFYPEGDWTHTCVMPERRGGRIIAPFPTITIARLANTHGSIVVPVYVEFGVIRKVPSIGMSLRRVLFEHPITISFGVPSRLGELAEDSAEQQLILRELMFDA